MIKNKGNNLECFHEHGIHQVHLTFPLTHIPSLSSVQKSSKVFHTTTLLHNYSFCALEFTCQVRLMSPFTPLSLIKQLHCMQSMMIPWHHHLKYPYPTKVYPLHLSNSFMIYLFCLYHQRCWPKILFTSLSTAQCWNCHFPYCLIRISSLQLSKSFFTKYIFLIPSFSPSFIVNSFLAVYMDVRPWFTLV